MNRTRECNRNYSCQGNNTEIQECNSSKIFEGFQKLLIRYGFYKMTLNTDYYYLKEIFFIIQYRKFNTYYLLKIFSFRNFII